MYTEEGSCTENDETTDKIYVSKLAHILDGYQNYIPKSYFCYEYTGGISLHYYEDRN